MSAFAVTYERSNTLGESGVFNRIMERLSHRGPDGNDIVSTANVSMGHWHFWTTPEEVNERQPLEITGLPFKIVLDGRLDNRQGLFSKLGITQSEGSNLSDAALTLRAYAEWGQACFQQFIGEYALAIFDEQRGELLCARDALGDRTLFYAIYGTRLVIASEPWAVAAADPSGVELNENAAAYYFALKAPKDGQTLFKNVYELLPAHAMLITATAERQWRYWQPDPSIRLRGLSDEEYAAQFLSVLEESVRCRMRSSTAVGVLMSGGLDSSSVACLAARMLAPEPLTTISYVFDELTECDERQYIETMTSRWGIRSIQIPCDDAWPYKDWQNWHRNPNQPEGNLYRLLKERAYEKTHQEGIRVLFTGAFGDELYSGAEDWLADLLVDGKFRAAAQELILHIRYATLRQNLEAGYLQRAARRLINTISGGADLHREQTTSDWLTSFSVDSLPKTESALYPDFQQRENLLGLWAAWDSSSEIFNASRHHIEIRNPYRDRRLVEFVLSLPAYQLYSRGVHKYILRIAMRGILPDMIRGRTKATSLLSLFQRGVEREKSILQSCFQNASHSWGKFVRANWLLKHWNVEVTPEQSGRESLVSWLCFSYEEWHKFIFLSN